jgi:polyketide cyclase/dehydrase/lipid transport protein
VASICIRTAVAAPADLLWEMLGRFNTLGQWHPMVKRSETQGKGRGALRRVRLIDGGLMIERLDHVSDADREYGYTVVATPFPVNQCTATIRVIDCGDGTSVVEWQSAFSPAGVSVAKATKLLRSVCVVGLQNVKRIYEPATTRRRLR